ncbi:MAG: glutamate 5-kinase, partial [Mailhella sp.]|nr:glutamate 5-kinase [Mailhella sp.]
MESREKTLASARTIVVKVGSAVLTTKQGLHLSVLYNLVEQLARLAAAGHRVCLVSSGAVAAGRTAIAGRGCTVEGVSGKQALAAIGQG